MCSSCVMWIVAVICCMLSYIISTQYHLSWHFYTVRCFFFCEEAAKFPPPDICKNFPGEFPYALSIDKYRCPRGRCDCGDIPTGMTGGGAVFTAVSRTGVRHTLHSAAFWAFSSDDFSLATTSLSCRPNNQPINPQSAINNQSVSYLVS